MKNFLIFTAGGVAYMLGSCAAAYVIGKKNPEFLVNGLAVYVR